MEELLFLFRVGLMPAAVIAVLVVNRYIITHVGLLVVKLELVVYCSGSRVACQLRVVEAL